VQTLDRIRIGDREVDEHERVVVAELVRGRVLAVQARGHLGPDAGEAVAAILQPPAQPAPHRRQDHVVDRDVLAE